VQELGRMGDVKISFTPHVIPAMRGIMTTAHIFTSKDVGEDQVTSLYSEFYRNCPFIRFNEPSLASVRGTNFCDLYVEKDRLTDRVVVISAIDNMVKGASGQAIQNMNLMSNLDQKTGLWSPALSL
jgi:N-acetyl-gamma-glutamyl-phosphate reductase